MKRCRRWLFAIVIYYSIYVGATVLRIDLKNRQLKRANRWIHVYVFIGNLAFVCWIPGAFQQNMSHDQLYASNPVATYANYATILTRFAVMISFAVTRSKRDTHLEMWLEKMLQIQTMYFDRFGDIPKDTSQRKWLYLNSVIAFFHTMGMAAGIYVALFKVQLALVIDMYILFGMVSVQHLYMLHHAALLCYVGESFSLLNNQLHLQRIDPKLGLIYSQVRSLFQTLNVIYSPIMLWMQLCLIISNSMVGYIGVLLLLLPQMNFSSYGYLFGNTWYLCLLIHTCVYFMICDWVVLRAKETNTLLFEYTTNRTDPEIEGMALSCCLYRTAINISGMFDINLNTLFSITAQTVLYTIILIQVDYSKILN